MKAAKVTRWNESGHTCELPLASKPYLENKK